jgi:hypothetical protein
MGKIWGNGCDLQKCEDDQADDAENQKVAGTDLDWLVILLLLRTYARPGSLACYGRVNLRL